ncbi:MAG: hypothetical protein GQ569_08855 [Methylococcaceae bacterium]|nr:hypothetical protein [Methylococcaceae bacterium]
MELEGSLADLSLANLLSKANADDKDLRYGFQIGNINLIYDVNTACELLKSTTIHAVPNTPKWMLGLINLRGGLVPVFDIEKYFDFEPREDKHQLLLVLGKGEKAVAFLLKEYPELVRNLTHLDTIPKLIPKIDGYILGAYKEKKLWLELDKEKFFSTLGEKVCI